MEHQIIRDHETNRSRGFGFIIYESEDVVDEMISDGNMIDMAGAKVSLFQCSPRSQHVNNYLFIMESAALHSSVFVNNIHESSCHMPTFSFILFNVISLVDYIFTLGGDCYRYRSFQERNIMVVHLQLNLG